MSKIEPARGFSIGYYDRHQIEALTLSASPFPWISISARKDDYYGDSDIAKKLEVFVEISEENPVIAKIYLANFLEEAGLIGNHSQLN